MYYVEYVTLGMSSDLPDMTLMLSVVASHEERLSLACFKCWFMPIDSAGIVFVVGQLFTHYCNCYHTTSIEIGGQLTMLLTLSGKGT